MMEKKIRFSELGRGLREVRGEMKLTDFGNLMTLTTSHICEIEKGNKKPSLNVLARYSRRTKTRINILFDGEI